MTDENALLCAQVEAAFLRTVPRYRDLMRNLESVRKKNKKKLALTESSSFW
jgi:hypothetical protein